MSKQNNYILRDLLATQQFNNGMRREQKIQFILAEYELQQRQSELARQSRDSRVNWYTTIIGGTVAGTGLFLGQNTPGSIAPQTEFIITVLLVFLFIVGMFALESVQRFNLNDVSSRVHMSRIRAWLSELEPEFTERLGWESVSELIFRDHWPLWIPTITVTINTFVAVVCCGILLYRLLTINTTLPIYVFSFTFGLLYAVGQIVYTRWKYRRLLAKLGIKIR